MKLNYVLMVKFVHDLYFKFDLLYKVMFDDFTFVNDLDGIDIL